MEATNNATIPKCEKPDCPGRETFKPFIHALMKDDAPETIEINGVWYDRRDTVDALNALLAEARCKIETYRVIIRQYRMRDLETNPTPPPQVSGA